METQDILGKQVGTKEAETLKPATVKIISVRIEEVGEKKNKKLVCKVKHPDREDLIDISSVKHEVKGSLKVVGLWVNTDEDGLIRKGSALANLISFLGASTPIDLAEKEVATTVDDAGYLCFKAY